MTLTLHRTGMIRVAAPLGGDRPVLTLDFDGCLHQYVSPFTEASVVPDPPVPGAFRALERYLRHFNVYVHTARFNWTNRNVRHTMQAVRDWFIQWGFPGHLVAVEGDWSRDDHHLVKLVATKPPSHVGIDDQVVTFTGRWPSPERLLRFKPWNHRSRRRAAIDSIVAERLDRIQYKQIEDLVVATYDKVGFDVPLSEQIKAAKRLMRSFVDVRNRNVAATILEAALDRLRAAKMAVRS